KDHALSVIAGLQRLAKEKKSDLAIFGMGGIAKLDDMKKFMDAGANCVQLCTTAIFNPLVAIEMRRQWSGKRGMCGSRALTDSRIRFTDEYAAETITRAFEVAADNSWAANEVLDFV